MTTLRATVKGDTLAVHTFACGRCHKPSQQAGRGYRFVLGARVAVCSTCKAAIDARRARARFAGGCMIVLTLPSPPSANSYWGTRVVKPSGKPAMAMVYVTHEARGYKADVAKICAAHGITKPLTGRIAMAIRLFPHRPLDWQARQRKHGATWDDTVRAIDLDNANKVLLDALKDIAFEDDRWIRRLQCERMEPDEHGARVIVAITQLAVPVVQGSLIAEAA